MAQSVARALLSARFCGRRCSLFSALVIESLSDYLVCRRRTFACPARAYARLRRWSRDAIESGLDAKRSLNDELFKDFAAPDQHCRDCDRDGERVTNHTLAIKADGKPIKNIVELAREHGRASVL